MATSIARILASKGHQVATTTVDAAIADAVAQLRDHDVGALIVVDDDEVLGILSERDVVRLMATDGAGGLGRSVGQVMTSPVTTCAPSSTTDELMAVMTEGRFRHLPVVDGTTLVGVVSIGDIVKWRLDELRAEADALTEYVAGGY